MPNVIHSPARLKAPTLYQNKQGALLLSGNCWHLLQEANAFWIIDCIVSHQASGLFEANTIQSWIFGNYMKSGWSAICEIGDETVLSLREISTKNFPLRSIHFVVNSLNNYCQLLSEFTD